MVQMQKALVDMRESSTKLTRQNGAWCRFDGFRINKTLAEWKTKQDQTTVYTMMRMPGDINTALYMKSSFYFYFISIDCNVIIRG